ncbi:hypothetical protein MTO96_012525 [Rhipicephalus appendiculatus]
MSNSGCLSKVQFRGPIQGLRTRPIELFQPGCSSRVRVRGRGLPGAVFVGRGLTLILGSSGPILLVGRDVHFSGTAHGSASVYEHIMTGRRGCQL